MTKLEDLRWVRLMQVSVIPKYLVEQIRHRDFSVEDFFKYQELNLMMQNGTLNPFNHLYALVSPDNEVKGILWFVIDPLTKDMMINTYSVDKEFWHQGLAVKKLAEHVKDILKRLQLKRVYWNTRYPKHSERYGFKRAKDVLMKFELEEEKDGKANGELLSTKRQPADA